MDEKKAIMEEYESYEDFPVTSIDIEPHPDYGEHYYVVKGRDRNGTFENEVFVDSNLSVLTLPE